jgi:hypothetical protein
MAVQVAGRELRALLQTCIHGPLIGLLVSLFGARSPRCVIWTIIAIYRSPVCKHWGREACRSHLVNCGCFTSSVGAEVRSFRAFLGLQAEENVSDARTHPADQNASNSGAVSGLRTLTLLQNASQGGYRSLARLHHCSSAAVKKQRHGNSTAIGSSFACPRCEGLQIERVERSKLCGHELPKQVAEQQVVQHQHADGRCAPAADIGSLAWACMSGGCLAWRARHTT